MTLLFNHIPKTGGNTVTKFLCSAFEPVYDYVPDSSDAAFQRWRTAPVDLTRMTGHVALIGHFTGPGCRPHERYPALANSPSVEMITFVRHPTELALSSYFYRLRTGDCVESEFENVLFEMVGIYSNVFSVKKEEDIADALNAYSFVGVTERMAESIEFLARRLQIDPPYDDVGSENASERGCYPAEWKSIRAAFDRAARLDHQIYQFAYKRLPFGTGL
jgi:hypothetical protein